MSSNPEPADFPASCARIGLSACLGALAILLLGACSSLPPVLAVSPAAASEDAQSAAQPGPASRLVAPESAAPPSASLAASPADAPVSGPPAEAVVRLLAYADRVRALPMPDLFREIARLGNPATPAEQLQLALSLGQLRQAAELARAQELLNRILSNPSAPAQALQPLARLLAARYAEQRRLEDQLDKQIQQTREVQRRLEQTHERLEALKAIERSLTSRPPAAASAPAVRRNRPAAP
jgi:hypothetical protein